MRRRLKLLLAGVLATFAGLCLITASAQAYTLSESAGTLTVGASTGTGGSEVPVVVSGAVSGSNVVFTPAADSTALANCTNATGTTTCPTSDFSTALIVQDAYVVNLSSATTATLTLDAAAADDQFDLSSVTVTSALDLDPGSSADTLDATGTVAAMALVNGSGTPVTDAGALSMDLSAGATTGTLNLGGGGNYIDAPTSDLNINSSGGDSTITAGGSIDVTGGGNLIHAVSTTQTINGGGSSSVDFLDVSSALTLTMEDSSSGSGQSVLVGSETTPSITNIDALTGGSGDNTMIATGDAADVMTGGPAENTFIPNSGPDEINGGTGNDNTIDYADVPATTPLTIDLATGSGGPTGGVPATQDELTDIQNAITGNGNDTVIAGPDGGTFQLGNGNDSFTGGAGNDTVTAGDGTDTLTGGEDNSTFTVGNGNDTLIGGAGNNYMQAGTGTDTFEAGWGTNTIIGGGGDDTVSYANRGVGQGVTVTLSDSGASTGNGQPGENDSISGIQNIIGGGGYNVLTGDGAANTITGGPNGNTITGGSGQDTLIGGAGNDIINSGSGSDTTIEGGGGNDTINATSGTDDQISCGSGDSTVEVNSTDTAAGNCTDVINPSIVPTTPTSTTPVVNPCTYIQPGQTCGGVTEPYPLMTTTIQPNWLYYGSGTQATEMTALDVEKGSGLSMTCQTPALHGCPFRSYVKNFTVNRASFAMLSQFKKKKMPAGTKITIRITNPLAVGVYYSFRLRVNTRKHEGPVETHGCLSPTTGKVITCPGPSGYLPSERARTAARRGLATRMGGG